MLLVFYRQTASRHSLKIKKENKWQRRLWSNRVCASTLQACEKEDEAQRPNHFGLWWDHEKQILIAFFWLIYNDERKHLESTPDKMLRKKERKKKGRKKERKKLGLYPSETLDPVQVGFSRWKTETLEPLSDHTENHPHPTAATGFELLTCGLSWNPHHASWLRRLRCGRSSGSPSVISRYRFVTARRHPTLQSDGCSRRARWHQKQWGCAASSFVASGSFCGVGRV